jgi:hypothetical protein
MAVRLLPAIIFIVIIFLAGLFFVQGRRVFSGAPPGQVRKAAPFIAATALLALSGLLFMFLGKLALLIAFLVVAVFFLSRKKAY